MMKMAKKSNEKKYKYKFIQFSVSDELKEDIDKYTKKSTFTTVSDFIRNAVEEKIRSLKNPEQSQSKTNQITPIILEKYLKNSQNFNLLEEKLLDKMKIFDDMKADLELLKKFSFKQGLVKETETIINLLKAHKSLSQKQIIEKTDLDKDTVFQVLSNDNRFKLNMNGRFELNE